MRLLRSVRALRPSPAAALAFAALILALAGFAVAAIPDSDGTIHACYKKKGGKLRVVKGSKCKKGEKSLSWNQKGQAGATNVTVRTATLTIAYGQPCAEPISGTFFCTGSNTATVPCSAGERATGGGFATDTANHVSVRDSTPSPLSGTPTGWTVRASANESGPDSSPPDEHVPVYAVCASP